MKRYRIQYTGNLAVAAALDDVLAYLHNAEMFGQKINLKSHTIHKAMVILRGHEIDEKEVA